MTEILTRLYEDIFDARHAIIELERVGVPAGDISLVAHKPGGAGGANVREPRSFTAGEAAAVDAGIGGLAGGAAGAAGGALAGLGFVAIPGLGPVVAMGWLISAAVGAVAGVAVAGAVGGIIGALTNAGVSEEEAHVYAEAVRRGGALISARVAQDRLAQAEAVLNASPHTDVAARGETYRAAGWTGFDLAALPYTDAEIERGRRSGLGEPRA
jgi:hypothetical protein